MAGRVTILVVDDHPLIMEGVQAQFGARPDVDLIGLVGTGAEAVRAVEEHRPDIVLMDISLPDINGLEVTRLILELAPDTAVIILSMHDDDEYVLRAVSQGARGYVVKSAAPDVLVTAVDAVRRGEFFFCPVAAGALARSYLRQERNARPRLTEREREVLAGLARGYVNKEIADQMELSVRTVETYRERLMQKLDLHNVADLTRYAIAEGIISVHAPSE